MKVIFTDNVPGVALKGDVKGVRNGYFRNYLLPFSKAVPETEPLMRDWEERKKKMMIDQQQLMAQWDETKRRLADVKLNLVKKVTNKGTLYGGVKAKDVTTALMSQCHVEVPESAVMFEAPIKSVGDYHIVLKLAEGVEARVAVEVKAKE